MKAAIFEKPGLENLKIKNDVEQPKITNHDVLIKVKAAGVMKRCNKSLKGSGSTGQILQPKKSSIHTRL